MGQLAELESPPAVDATPPVLVPEPPPVLAPEPPPAPGPPSAKTPFQVWLQQEGYWFITSAVVHAIGFVVVAIVVAFFPGRFYDPEEGRLDDAPTYETELAEPQPTIEIESTPGGIAPLDPSSLSPDTLRIKTVLSQTARYYDDSAQFEERGGGRPTNKTIPQFGGLGGLVSTNPNGVGAGPGGVGGSIGTGENAGAGGEGTGFGSRGKGHREAVLGSSGGTRATEIAVARALNWLARHQEVAGNWSLQFKRCPSAHGCGGQGTIRADAAATAMGLLAFLGAGQTHRTKGPYEKTVSRGISWLMKHQQANGDLSMALDRPMYSHGLATMALCEAYGMTQDTYVGEAASRALRYIELAQNPTDGGWRYFPGSPGDTSVTGWQVMALKCGQIAKLPVNPAVLENTEKWLRSMASGRYGGLYRYQAQHDPTPSMTAVGMLCRQYLGIDRDAPSMVEGKAYLLAHPPNAESDRDIYYWYYATLAMHNFMDKEWDEWNRQMRRTLISTQCRAGGCAEGSWDPERPTVDRYGRQGGRLMLTSLSALTLEVYYRWMPLFKVNLPQSHGPGAPIQNACAAG